MAKLGDPLDEFLDDRQIECLNQDKDNPVANAFQDGEAFLASDQDVDSELLVKVQFRQPVKIGGIKVMSPAEEGIAPQSVRIFQGKTDIGFGEAADDESTQDLVLEAESVREGKAIPLRFVKFQSVTSIQLFFPNDGQDQTKVQRIQFLGEPSQKMDMKDWKPIKG